MSDTEKAATAPTAPTPAPKSDADYRAAAMKVAEQNFGKKPEPVVEPEKAAEPAKPAEPEKKPELPPEPPLEAKNWFQKLAQDQKALREERKAFDAERAALKSLAELSRVVDPDLLQRAVVQRDPLTLLQAAGMKYQDVVDAVVKAQPAADEKPKVEETPDVNPLKSEIEELKKKLSALEERDTTAKVEAARAQVLAKAVPLVKPERFPIISRFPEEAVQEALDTMNDLYRQTGRLPGDNFEENMNIALAEVEARHKKLASKYAHLTSAPTVATVPANEAPASPRGTAEGQTTLSSAMAPGLSGASATPKTDKDYQLAAIEAAKRASATRR